MRNFFCIYLFIDFEFLVKIPIEYGKQNESVNCRRQS